MRNTEHIICQRPDGRYDVSYNTGTGWVDLPPAESMAAARAAIEAAANR